MKKKIVAMLSLVLCLTLGTSLAACKKNKHEAKNEWSFNESKHWHECAAKDHDDKLDEADHTWNDGEITVDPTETAEGVKTYACTVCDQTKTEPVPKLSHTHTFDTSAWEKDENKHWRKATCAHTDLKQDEADHAWNNGEITVEPTEAAEGVKTYACTVCAQKKTEPVEKLAHTHTFDTSAWEKDENKHWHKATCAHTDLKQDEADHTGAWTVKTPADYGVNKVEERTCTVCGKHQEQTVENSALAAKDNPVTVGTIAFTYNGKSQSIDSLVTAANKAGMVIKYVVDGETTYAESTTAPKNAGTYRYTITIPATAEWNAAEVSGEYTIAKYELTELYKKQTKEYDGTKMILFAFNTLEDNKPVNISVTMDSANVGAKVSKIQLPELLKNDNYTVDKDKVQIEIVAKKLSKLTFTVTESEFDKSNESNTIERIVKTGVKVNGVEEEVKVVIEFNGQWLDENDSLNIHINVGDSGSCKISFKETNLNYEFVAGLIGELQLVRETA